MRLQGDQIHQLRDRRHPDGPLQGWSGLPLKAQGRKLQAKVHLTFTPKHGAKLKTTTTVLVS